VNPDGTTISVMMPKIARKTLGLRDGSFSRVAIEDSALLFRGDGMTGPVRVPVAMMGTFHNDLLNNLFLYLANNRQNGILCVTTGPLTKVVFFKRGQIVFSGTTDASERLGNVLVRLGFTTREALAAVEAREDPRRFGVRCRDAGLITQEQLWEALRVQIVGICCSLVHFPVGHYFFLPNCVPADWFNHFVIDPSEVLFESMLRLDEQERRAAPRPPATEGGSPLGVLSSIDSD
jgi:hypothetical protein